MSARTSVGDGGDVCPVSVCTSANPEVIEAARYVETEQKTGNVVLAVSD